MVEPSPLFRGCYSWGDQVGTVRYTNLRRIPTTILARNPHACWCKHMHKLNICLNKEILVSINILHSFSTWLYMCVWSISKLPPRQTFFSLGPSLTYTSSFTLSPLAVFVGYCQCEAWIDKPPLFVMGGKPKWVVLYFDQLLTTIYTNCYPGQQLSITCQYSV